MESPLVLYPADTVILPPRLFSTADYYYKLLTAGCSVIDITVRYDKRCKPVHRYDIIDARGKISLTVPLGKPFSSDKNPTWLEAPVSTHDEWWKKHITTLESAYGRTPYFEFLIDKFSNVFRSPKEWSFRPNILDLIVEANKAVCSVISPEKSIIYKSLAIDSANSSYNNRITDFRKNTFFCEHQRPYWQIRQNLFGFCGGLSILDLIFNLGPESGPYILNYYKSDK